MLARISLSLQPSQGRAGGRVDPVEDDDFVLKRASRLPGDERADDDVVRPNAFALALDCFDVPVEDDDTGLDPNFSEFTGDRERHPSPA